MGNRFETSLGIFCKAMHRAIHALGRERNDAPN